MTAEPDTTPPLSHPGWDRLLDAALKHEPTRWQRLKRAPHFWRRWAEALLRKVRP